MKYRHLICVFAAALVVSGCTYTYSRGVDQAAPAAKVSTISFDNHVEMVKIDGQDFSPKFSIWRDGRQVIRLPPGQHTFTVGYDGGAGGYYTRGLKTLTKTLLAGRSYVLGTELGHNERGAYFAFAIEDVTGLYDK